MQVIGIGTATPEFAFTQADRFEVAQHFFEGSEKERRLLPILFEKTGVQNRFSCLLNSAEGSIESRQSLFKPFDRETGGVEPSTGERIQVFEKASTKLAMQAVLDVLNSTHCDPADLTHLITVSCTGFSAPGFDLHLVDQIPLSPSIQRTHIGFMGCHGGLNGLRVAAAFTKANPAAKVLLCATELCTLHYQYAGAPDQLIANALFADGAMALIGHGEHCEPPATGTGWSVADSASYVIPDSQQMMSWSITDTGFRMSLSAALPALIQDEIQAWLKHWLGTRGLTLEEIRGWAVHPGGPKILSSFSEAMDLERSTLRHSYEVLAEKGNMSSATVYFILQRMMREDYRLPCVALGFGPGITIEAALFLPS